MPMPIPTSPYIPADGPRATAWRELAAAALALIEATRARDVAARHARGVGLSWAEIGQAAGMSRQAAWERWG